MLGLIRLGQIGDLITAVKSSDALELKLLYSLNYKTFFLPWFYKESVDFSHDLA